MALTALVTLGSATSAEARRAVDRIGPGVQLVTAGRTCTAGFVFRDGGRLYLGYAASCAARGAVPANRCSARSLRLGTAVRIVDRGREVGTGTLAYSSFRSLRLAGVTDPAACAAGDFALVRLPSGARRAIDATVPHWGGPTGLAGLPTPGGTVFGLGRSGAAQALPVPKAGDIRAVDGDLATIFTPLPGTRRERGGVVLDDAGRAVGMISSVRPSGHQAVGSLAAQVAFARGHGLPGLRVVPGGAFSGGVAIL